MVVENDEDLYESMASGEPEEEWIDHRPGTQVLRLGMSSQEPEILLEDAHNLVVWTP